MSAKEKFDIYKMVTERIIAQLESGVIPWEKPWVGASGAWKRKNGERYSLLNQFLLPCGGEYASLKQIKEAGGELLKDENGRVIPKAKYVVFWKMHEVTDTDDEGNEVRKTIPLLRYCKVFNVETDTTLETKYHKEEFVAGGVEAIDELELIKRDYVARSGVEYHENRTDTACYFPSLDAVQVPLREQFDRPAEYYSTVFHELAHSTGHPSRLNRINDVNVAAFGSDDYSREELVAELTSCAVLANRGIETSESFRNNSAYIGAWLAKLKEDTHAIVWASSRAEKAYNLIMGIENDDESVEE